MHTPLFLLYIQSLHSFTFHGTDRLSLNLGSNHLFVVELGKSHYIMPQFPQLESGWWC